MILYTSTILFAPVAQLVEHLTFNQRVRDSSSRRSTKQKDRLYDGLFVCFCEELDHVAVSEGFVTLLRPSLWEARKTEQNSRRSGCFDFSGRLYDGLFVCFCEELDHVAVSEGFVTLLRPSLWEARKTEQNSRRSGCFDFSGRLYGGLFVCFCEELDHVAVSEAFVTLLRPSLWEARKTEQNSCRSGCFDFSGRLYDGLFVCFCEELDHVRAKHEGILPLGVLLYLIALFLPVAYNISSPGKIPLMRYA